MQGIIALDIDNTITYQNKLVPVQVLDYFEELLESGWKIALITGRPLRSAEIPLQDCRLPIVLSTYNGALAMDFLSKKVLKRDFLPQKIIPHLDVICKEFATAPVVYAGYEHNEKVFYQTKAFSNKWISYFNWRKANLCEDWIGVDNLEESIPQDFPAFKYFGNQDLLDCIAQKVLQETDIQMPVIKDPVHEGVYLAQGTHAKASKGDVIRLLKKMWGKDLTVIAAGDDYNDLPLLGAADIKIAMTGAPDALLNIADLIAPSVKECGIISALKKAIKQC